MNVAEVPKKDWSLYFNRVYMLYDGDVVLVQPSTAGNKVVLKLHYNSTGKMAYIDAKEDLKKLEVWWPRPGAYNREGNAVYIARKATRCMRKSCCPRTHYYIKWGGELAPAINYLIKGPNHMSWESAREALDTGTCTSVAVCRDLIVKKPRANRNRYGIVYRGLLVGDVEDGEFLPENEFSQTTKLVYTRLVEEGIV